MEQAQIELWVLDAKRGNEAAFTQLCRHFHTSLLRFSFKLSDNEQLTHDAVQNSWISITKSIHRINDPRAFRSWIYQAVRWQTLDLLRKNKNTDNWQSDENIDDLVIEQQKSNSDPKIDSLLSHINNLTDIDKQAIHLFYLEEMSLQEISIILTIPIGTIKSRLNRARNALKKKFNQRS